MRKSKERYRDLGEKILKGVQLAASKLIASRIEEDGYLIYGQNGKVNKVRARDIKTS